MTPSRDWYRSEVWDSAVEEEFRRRLKRARSDNRPQYMRIQASYLEGAKLYEGAIGLLEEMISTYPESSERACAHWQLATSLAALGRDEEALAQFRLGLIEETKPGMHKTGLWGAFCRFVLQRGLAELYEEARAAANSPGTLPSFPVDGYRLGAIEAFAALERGERELATDWARQALDAARKDHSGYRHHPKIGLVEDQGERDKTVREQLERIASEKA